jgi:hypothetical protein
MFHGYKKAIKILTEYANNQGFKVDLEFNDISIIEWDDLNFPYKISIDGSLSIEEKVYVFLHELGHNELRKDWVEYKRVMPIVAYAESVNASKYRRRIGYYVSCLEEEFKAWDKGEELAKNFGIKINKKSWYKLKNKNLMSYIRYFGKK